MDRIDQILEGISDSFNGRLARDEEIAADDLALSFRQGRALREVLAQARGLSLLAEDGVEEPITLLGGDYVGAGNPLRSLIPLDHAVVQCLERVEPPLQTAGSWIEKARSWRGSHVVVRLAPGELAGVLSLVGPEHVVIDRGEEIVIPAGQVRVLTLCHEG